MSLKYDLFDKYNMSNSLKKKEIYEKLVESFKVNKTVCILVNSKNSISNIDPMIIPVKDTNWIALQFFNSKSTADEYCSLNNIDTKFIQEINTISALLLLTKLFFKGVTGFLYLYKKDIITKTIYVPTEIVSENRLINSNNKELLYYLNKNLNTNSSFFYIHDKTITDYELQNGIVEYKKRYNYVGIIDIFETEELAKKFYRYNKIFVIEKIPVAPIKNDFLFNSINKLIEDDSPKKISMIYFHTVEKVYKVPIEDFIQMLINIGYKQSLY